MTLAAMFVMLGAITTAPHLRREFANVVGGIYMVLAIVCLVLAN